MPPVHQRMTQSQSENAPSSLARRVRENSAWPKTFYGDHLQSPLCDRDFSPWQGARRCGCRGVLPVRRRQTRGGQRRQGGKAPRTAATGCWSRPVSRVLSPRPLSRRWRPFLYDAGCPAPPATVPAPPCLAAIRAGNPLPPEGGRRSLFGLAPGGVFQASPVTRGTGELLPRRFTLTLGNFPARGGEARGGLLSVALSFPSPGLRVTEHPALRSSDFPPAAACAAAGDRPAGSNTRGECTARRRGMQTSNSLRSSVRLSDRTAPPCGRARGRRSPRGCDRQKALPCGQLLRALMGPFQRPSRLSIAWLARASASVLSSRRTCVTSTRPISRISRIASWRYCCR